MAWVYLLFAGLFEIGWAIGLKYTDGFTKFWLECFHHYWKHHQRLLAGRLSKRIADRNRLFSLGRSRSAAGRCDTRHYPIQRAGELWHECFFWGCCWLQLWESNSQHPFDSSE